MGAESAICADCNQLITVCSLRARGFLPGAWEHSRLGLVLAGVYDFSLGH
jgi:hypothetical protein